MTDKNTILRHLENSVDVDEWAVIGVKEEFEKLDKIEKIMKLSVIIPYYNAMPYTKELLDVLNPQVTDEIEVIVVDDGSREPFETDYPWVKVIYKPNGGCASARNVGLDHAHGEYISFIDADDMVSGDFIKKILEKTKQSPQPDVIDLSWRSLDNQGVQHDHRLTSDSDYLTNPSVCTRVLKTAFIDNNRFNELKDSTEDEDFSRKVGYLDRDNCIIHASVTDYAYFYRTAVPNSKIKRFKLGLMRTKRIVYYVPEVAADDLDLLEQIKKDDEQNEVWLLTGKCNMSELKKYCQISKPFKIWAHKAKGEPCSLIDIIKEPIRAQVVIYCQFAAKVGGITTFIRNFCKLMKNHYDIVFVYEKIDFLQLKEISKMVKCVEYGSYYTIVCDTLILNRLTDLIHPNIYYKKVVQMIHCCRQTTMRVPEGRDLYINVSQAAKDSWGDVCKDALVIHNPLIDKGDKLFMISATRIGATDKGDNDKRMRIFANMLNDKEIPFVWLNFSDRSLEKPPKNFYNMPAMSDVTRLIKAADYLVQLSDEEAYSYAILEALACHTAVLATPFDSLFEQGFIDGKTGYLIPKDMDFDVEKLKKVPNFQYNQENENKLILSKWLDVLGEPHPTINYYHSLDVPILCQNTYYDMNLERTIKKGEHLMMSKDRAQYIESIGYIQIVGE